MKTLEGSSKIISMEPKIIGLGGKQIVTAGKVQTEERINATDGRISIEGKPMNNQIRSSLRLDEKVSRPSNKQMMQDRSGRSTVSKNSDSFKSHKQIGSINNGSEKNLNRWQVPVQTKRSEI